VLCARTAGLLLAGGRSQRFGTEKALAYFREAPMMDVIALRFGGLGALAVSARPNSGAEQRARQLGLPVLHDAAAFPAGPLSGVCAGLQWATELGLSLLATAPCDAPLLPMDLFPRLVAAIGASPAAYARTFHKDHPLCAVWNVRLLATLQAKLNAGVHPSVRRLLADIGAKPVSFADERAFLNANTPDALTELERAA
jgi:molybdopterin-guanine dinucleotide biosynthesis protein A